MTTPLVITVISADKPGLVESLAQVINRHGGNWLESRMARMAGQFAGILRVDVANDQLEALRIDLDGLSAQGINVQVAISGQADEPQQRILLHRFSVFARVAFSFPAPAPTSHPAPRNPHPCTPHFCRNRFDKPWATQNSHLADSH